MFSVPTIRFNDGVKQVFEMLTLGHRWCGS